MNPRFMLGILLTIILSVPLAEAQITGAIAGTVFDASGGVVPGATIVIKDVGTSVERTLLTEAALAATLYRKIPHPRGPAGLSRS